MESPRADSHGKGSQQQSRQAQRAARGFLHNRMSRRRSARSADDPPQQQQQQQQQRKPAKRPRKEAKEHSSFFELRRTLSDGPAVASYIDEHHGTRLRNPRHMNSFFQALSNCHDDLFACITQEHKPQVHLALVRMYELYSSGQVPMSLAAHEFIIRCEQHGVRKAEWHNAAPPSADTGDGPAAHSGGAPLLSPRDLLRRLAAIDARGRLERLIEMCATPVDLRTCARKLCAADRAALDYATTCRLVSKLASKARRVLAASEGKEETEETEETEEEAIAGGRAAVGEMFGALLDATRAALASRPLAAAPQQPIARLSRLAQWCGGRGLLDAPLLGAAAALDAQNARDMCAQAAQLETVARLKALPTGDAAALREALDDLWSEADGRFEPHSADVLSAIALACKGLPDATREVAAERLVRTQRWLAAGGGALPRRALHFVNEVQSRLKQESVRRMLAEQDKVREEA